MPSSSTVVNLLDEDDDDEFARFDQEQLRKALLLRTARSSTTTSLPPTEYVHATTSHSQSTILPSSDDGATTTTTTTVANSVPSSATARITSEIQSSPPFSLAESNRLFEEGQSPPLPPLSSSSSKVSFSGVVDSDNTSRRLTSTQSSPPVVLERGPQFSPPVSSTLSINPHTSITSNPSLVGGRQQRTSIPPASASSSIFSSSSIFGAIGGGEKSRLKSKTGVPFAVVKAKKKSRSGLCRQLCTWLIKMECEI